MKKAFIFLCMILLFSCGESDFYDYKTSNSDFNIYLVKEGQLEIHGGVSDINHLELENMPWVKGTDILFYDWSAHTFYLNKEIEKSSHSGKHFVISSGEKRLFAGVFWPMFMSSIPMIPAIFPEDEIFNPEDIIRFSQFGFYEPGKLDENLEFKKALLEEGLLRKGIKVELTKIHKQNSEKIRYTFTVTNLDNENIYVPDPDKMGANRFHYYTNGISLEQNNTHFQPSGFETKPSEFIQSKWLVKIKPGTKITRTVTMEGYSSLPTGKVLATFRFPGAHLKESGAWKKSDGRIWLGDFIVRKKMNVR